MSEQIEITFEPHTTPEKTLLTARKYCDKNIHINATPLVAAEYGAGVTFGREDAHNAFWDVFQQNGTRTNYKQAFYGIGWDDVTYNPKHPVVTKDASSMYADSVIAKHIEVDTSQSTTLELMFYRQRYVQSVGVIDSRSASNIRRTFLGASSLHTIDKLILKDDGSQMFYDDRTFEGCTNLANITIEGAIGCNLSMKDCLALSRASVTSIVNALSATASGLTLTMHSGVKTKFTDAEWATLIATKSNWTISLV